MIEHPNVVKLIEVLATNSKIYIVLELVSGGDLFDKIRMQKYVQTENRPGMMCGKRILVDLIVQVAAADTCMVCLKTRPKSIKKRM